MAKLSKADRMPEDSRNFMWELIDDTGELIADKFPTGQLEHGGFILDMGLTKLIQEDKKEKIDGLTYGRGIEILVDLIANDPVIKKRCKEIGIKL